MNEALTAEHENVTSMRRNLNEDNLPAFIEALTSFRDSVLAAYSGENPESAFYHTNKLIKRSRKFGSAAKKNRELEIEEIRSEAGAVLRDLQLIIEKLA